MPLLQFPRHVPRFQTFQQQPPAAVAPPPLYWTSASSSQVTVNTWSVYDSTTGPVHPPSIDAPQVLPDYVSFKKRPQINVALASSSADPIFIPPTAPPQVLPDDGGLRKQLRSGASASATADPVFIPPLPLSAVLSDAPGFRPRAQKKLDEGTAASIFIPPAAPPPVVLPDDQGFRKGRVSAALASSPIAAVFVPFAPPTFVGSSSSTIVRHGWLVYDPTTGPVAPPPVPPPPYIPAASDSSIVTGDVDPAWPVAKKFLPLPTSVVIAIPVVDNLWFEALDVPTRLKGKRQLSETVQPLTLPTAPPAVAPLAFASSGQITVNSWSVYDPSTGPVLPTPLSIVPPSILGADWLEQSLIVPARRKGVFDPIAVTLQPPPSVVAQTLIDSQSDIRPRLRAKGSFDQFAAPISPPVVVGPSILGADWLEQSLTIPTRRKAALSFDPIAAPLQPPPFIPPPPDTDRHQLPMIAYQGAMTYR